MQSEFTAIIEKDRNRYIGYCPEITGANDQGQLSKIAETV